MLCAKDMLEYGKRCVLVKLQLESNVIRHLLKNMYFINGTAYAGKSTMVRLLSEKYDGIQCGENYHDELMSAIDTKHQPNLSYFETMTSWQEFIGRTPEEYDAWIVGCAREATDLEIAKLIQLSAQDRKVFVDTNIPISILKEIADYHHIAIMLSPQSLSVERFFDREDEDKQFIYQQIQKAQYPIKAMENYKNCLAKVNSLEHYKEYEESGFYTYIRNEDSTISKAMAEIEKHFLLQI
ncbi:hypothetical protein [Lachnoclostridium sp.]|uniref:hypothetical protein n=2 Tax=Lachnoclostridium sp. TaxID=2028282 RepID=UPI00269FEBBA|nr:hypothetical protein [Lachnoclostridium sp.]